MPKSRPGADPRGPYHEASLKKLKEEIAHAAGSRGRGFRSARKAFTQESALYDRLQSPARDGPRQSDLNVPTYNGACSSPTRLRQRQIR
jgi:hypothetical protein